MIERQPQAFNPEYKPHIKDGEIIDDITHYLGEYRFHLEKDNYTMILYDGKLCDPYRLEPMIVKSQRAIEKKRAEGQPTHREESDSMGLLNLEKQLQDAGEGDTIFQASPPELEDYGFLNVGKLKRTSDIRAEVQMTASRIERPTLEKFNMFLSLVAGKDFSFTTADEFVANPVVIRNFDLNALDKILWEIFEFRVDPEEKSRAEKALLRLTPLIDEFVANARYLSLREKGRALHAIENLAIKLWNDTDTDSKIIHMDIYRNLDYAMRFYGFEPPKILGSCGSTGKVQSNNTLNFSYGALNESLNEWFKCPKCHYQADGPIGNTCPRCGLTKEQFTKENPDRVCA